MADFDSTHAWWDKHRPDLLASTGLGKALKSFEAAKKQLEKSKKPKFRFFDETKKKLAA